MQKVEGSSPFSRFNESPASRGVFVIFESLPMLAFAAGTTCGSQTGRISQSKQNHVRTRSADETALASCGSAPRAGAPLAAAHDLLDRGPDSVLEQSEPSPAEDLAPDDFSLSDDIGPELR